MRLEVEAYNECSPEIYRGLVQPKEAERVLGGFRVPSSRQLDWREQFEAARDAFSAGRILLLVDDRQVERLDEAVTIGTSTTATFLKLVPLVGG